MPRILKRLAAMSPAALLPLALTMPALAVDKESLGGQDWRDTITPQSAEIRDANAGLAGLFPGSFLVPGTNTSIRVGGYVKLDGLADFGRDGGDFVMIAKLPSTADGVTNNRTGEVRLHARQSRFDIESRTPSPWGEVQTYLEGDFFGNTGGGSSTLVTDPSGFSLRHAYGKLGNFLAGHTWSLAMDLDASPETLDFGGPNGFVFIRQGQIRWTQPLSLWQVPLTIAASIENPEGDFLGKAGNNSVADQASSNVGGSFTISPNVWNKFPDIVTRVSAKQTANEELWYFLVRDIRADTGLVHASTIGWQSGVAAAIHTWGKDTLKFQGNFGDGGGRYINGFSGQGAAWNGAKQIQTQVIYGGYVYYQHWWNDDLRSNLGVGGARAFNAVSIIGPIVRGGQNPTRATYEGHLNLIWSPIANTNFGVEYIHGQREEESRDKATLNRFQISAQYLF